MDVEARLRWRRGHELEIFSVSQNRWFKGNIQEKAKTVQNFEYEAKFVTISFFLK